MSYETPEEVLSSLLSNFKIYEGFEPKITFIHFEVNKNKTNRAIKGITQSLNYPFFILMLENDFNEIDLFDISYD